MGRRLAVRMWRPLSVRQWRDQVGRSPVALSMEALTSGARGLQCVRIRMCVCVCVCVSLLELPWIKLDFQSSLSQGIMQMSGGKPSTTEPGFPHVPPCSLLQSCLIYSVHSCEGFYSLLNPPRTWCHKLKGEQSVFWRDYPLLHLYAANVNLWGSMPAPEPYLHITFINLCKCYANTSHHLTLWKRNYLNNLERYNAHI